jgi:hypothetical protein
MERFNLKKLKEVESKEQYRVEISNRFVALENLDTEVDVNTAWGTIRENIKTSAKENLGYYELEPCGVLMAPFSGFSSCTLPFSLFRGSSSVLESCSVPSLPRESPLPSPPTVSSLFESGSGERGERTPFGDEKSGKAGNKFCLVEASLNSVWSVSRECLGRVIAELASSGSNFFFLPPYLRLLKWVRSTNITRCNCFNVANIESVFFLYYSVFCCLFAREE